MDMARPTLFLLAAVSACAARPHQILGPDEVPAPPMAPVGPQPLVGLMCPSGASGRPLLIALAARTASGWRADATGVRAAVAGDLSVFAFDGRRAGRFAPVGPVDLGLHAPTAVGAYAGAPTCADDATATECAAVLGACGVAVSDELPAAASGAAVADGRLVLAPEVGGALASFALGELGGLPEEVTGAAWPGLAPGPLRFALAAGGGVDVLAVGDLDGDGRVEVVVARRDPAGGRRIALYSATATLRLERVAAVDYR
jgi:hypothetical protein